MLESCMIFRRSYNEQFLMDSKYFINKVHCYCLATKNHDKSGVIRVFVRRRGKSAANPAFHEHNIISDVNRTVYKSFHPAGK